VKYIDLITNAYRLRNVIDTTQAPDAEQGTTAVTLLNQMMAELLADSVDLQYVPITYAQVGDDLTIPVYAEGGITAALAMRLRAAAPISLELEAQASGGMSTILRKAIANSLQPPSMQHVPQGEGTRRNRGDFYSGI
jgi:hypothetical protein